MIKTLEIFWQFFLLGWTSFGGPAAHIGYFRHAFVEKLQWLRDEQYSQLVALNHLSAGLSLGDRDAACVAGCCR